jgi:hypothetical protein
MRWHAEHLHVIILLETLSDPAQDVTSLRLDTFAEAGGELHLLVEILQWEVEYERHVHPFPLLCHLLPLIGLP